METRWECVSQCGPCVAHHTGSLVGDQFYVHGGINKTGSTDPLNTFSKFDLNTKTWTNLTNDDSPYLSHHASVVLENKYLVLIGGWTGKNRSSDIYIYNTEKNSWQKAICDGFPQGAGLSSHTALALKQGEILIIGREGSLRTQRRSGNSFLLKGSPSKGQFTYFSYPISVASRSGHTTNGTGNRIVTIGGRDDKTIEQYTGYSSSEISCNILTKLKEASRTCEKLPARKNHVSVLGEKCVFLHGGETFDGRNRNPVGEMYFVCFKPSLSFRYVGLCDVCRTGHVTCWTENSIFIHGGFDEKRVAQGSVHTLIIE